MKRRREESQSDETDFQAGSTHGNNEAMLAAITKLLDDVKKSMEGRLESMEACLSAGQTEQRRAAQRMDEALAAVMNRIKALEEGRPRSINIRIPTVNKADELARVRVKFVTSVSRTILGQLLDDILEDGVLNDEEKDSILEENRTTADKARSLIDRVRKKGDMASTIMIAHLHKRDPMLSTELGLLCGQPALPGAEPQMKQEGSTLMIRTTDVFWREKQYDIDIYPVTKKSFGKRVALLITNIKFTNERLNRRGSEKDEENMDKLIKALGYEVIKYRDLTAKEIDTAMMEFSKHPNLRETDSVLVVVMSHGVLGAVLGVDLEKFYIDNIYKHLGSERCPALLNKPKIIIIQACRGDDRGSVLVSDRANPGPSRPAAEGNVEDDAARCVHKEEVITSLVSSAPEEGGSVLVSDGPSPPVGEENRYSLRHVHKEKDFSSLLSSTPDTVSYRQIDRGSIFIQYVVEVFSTFAHKDDTEELFRKVMQRFEDFNIANRRQMPTKDRCTLTKRFYFFPGLSGQD